jgi:signal peptidase II
LRSRTRLASLLLLTSTIGCDQVSKEIASRLLAGRADIAVLRGALRLRLAENRGAFLSGGRGLPEAARFAVFVVIVGGALLVGVGILLSSKRLSMLSRAGLALLLGGGLGNLADRLVRGQVIDFVMLRIGPLQTGVFNLADVAIIAGAILLLWSRKPSPSAPVCG